MALERISRHQIEEERLIREVKYLTPIQKKTLLDINKGMYDNDDFEGFPYDSPTGIAIMSLEDLGLLQISLTKGGVGVRRLTTKGKLLLLENSKLRFPLPEFTRWVITTTIAGIALVISLIALLI